LTHVVQQQGGVSVQREIRLGAPDDDLEREAERVAKVVAGWERGESCIEPTAPIQLNARASMLPRLRRAFVYRGSLSWDIPGFEGHRAVIPVWVGTDQDWSAVLPNMDSEDVYRQWLQGFLSAAVDPQHFRDNQFGFKGFRDDVSQLPSEGEIVAFLKALYYLGEPLDLPDKG